MIQVTGFDYCLLDPQGTMQALLRNPEHIQASYIYWLYMYILYENAAHCIYSPVLAVVYIPHIYVYKDVR